MSLFFVLLSSALAQTADDIIRIVTEKQQWSQAILEIELDIEQEGKKNKQYQLRTQMRKDERALYTHSEFLAPKKVSGTKIIAIDYQTEPDQLHLFMPALGRVNTLRSSSKKRAFMGSDLRFEDLDISSYDGTHSIVTENDQHWTIETKGEKHPEYARWVSIIAKSNHRPTKIDFFDRENNLCKTLTIGDSSPTSSFPSSITIEDPKRRSKTNVIIRNQQSNDIDIPMSLFEKSALVPMKESK